MNISLDFSEIWMSLRESAEIAVFPGFFFYTIFWFKHCILFHKCFTYDWIQHTITKNPCGRG